jgi:branched-chain amino acid transport system substrate-binding protein
VVACDDAEAAETVAAHLVDLASPAVIGFASGTEAIDLATSTFVPHNVMTLVSTSISPLVTRIPQGPNQPRLTWRTTYSLAAMAKPVAAVVEELEAQIRRARPGVAPLRVAQLRGAGRTHEAAAEAIFAALRFNDKSALENVKEYREFVLPDDDFDATAREVARFEPDVIVQAPSGRGLDAIERAWPSARRPTYVVLALEPSLLEFLGKSADRRRRMWALNAVSTTTANARFVVRYNDTFRPAITRSESPTSPYDAFYVIAFASYAQNGEAMSGDALARGIPKLVPPGVRVDVGPTGILSAFGTLRSGGSVDLNGATGALDFDLTTGDAPVDFAVICPDVDASGKAIGGLESGVIFDAAAGRLTGPLRCP